MQLGHVLIVGNAASNAGDRDSGSSELADRLRGEGYSVDLAPDASAGLGTIEDDPPDIIIVGSSSGGMDRPEFLRRVQARTRDAVAIALTSADSPDSGLTAMREGASAYLTTPLNLAEASLVVRREMERVRLRGEAATLRERATLASFGASEGIRIPGTKLADIERYAILRAVESTHGSTSKAAALLGISVRKVQYKLHEYNSGPGDHPDQMGSPIAPPRGPLENNGQSRATPRNGH